jgi:Methyltransferase domain
MTMESSAWRPCPLVYPSDVPTMISPEERQYLYWLGARMWTGQGCVVEIGPWLGGSTVCLAAGMRDSGRDALGQLKVFDNFLWREFMAARANLPLAPGSSFEQHFLEQTAGYKNIIECSARALPDEAVAGDLEAAKKRFTESDSVPLFDGSLDRPVEILFIDGAKSWRGMRHLFRALASRFLHGTTLLVCQDFKYWGTYWVPALMMRIRECVEPVHNVLTGTTVAFRLIRPIPGAVLDALEDHVALLSTSETLDAIERAAEMLSADGDWTGALTVRLCTVSFLAHQDKAPQAAAALTRLLEQWPDSVPTEQLDRARTYLEDEKGQPVSPPVAPKSTGLYGQ